MRNGLGPCWKDETKQVYYQFILPLKPYPFEYLLTDSIKQKDKLKFLLKVKG